LFVCFLAGVFSPETQIDALTLEWLGTGPVEDAVYAPLLQRFQRCRAQEPIRG
jgi:hypothetical protein